MPVLLRNKIKRIHVTFFVIFALGMAVIVSFPGRPPDIVTKTWIWDTSLIVSKPKDILDFAEKRHVDAIYLYIDKVKVSQQQYRAFIGQAELLHIKVEALAGDPSWALPSNRDEIRKFIGWVKSYNAASRPNERFQGLHFDIEPYLLEDWEKNNGQLLRSWMDNLRLIKNEADGTGLKLSLDVPFWTHTIKVPDSGATLSSWMLSAFDCLVLMDYRNTALGEDGIVQNAEAVVREATSLNKEVIVGVETGKSGEGERTTFYSFSMSAMEKQLGLADRHLSRYSGYKGLAVHDYTNWSKLSDKES